MAKSTGNKEVDKAMDICAIKAQQAGMRSGAQGIAGYILEICNKEDGSIEKVKEFCMKTLGLCGGEDKTNDTNNR